MSSSSRAGAFEPAAAAASAAAAPSAAASSAAAAAASPATRIAALMNAVLDFAAKEEPPGAPLLLAMADSLQM